MQLTLDIETRQHDDWVDITAHIARAVVQAPSPHGVVNMFVPHTTAGITVQENADPPLRADITQVFEKLFPKEGGYGHCEDNAASHMKTVVTGASLQVPYAQGRLLLGRWQAIYLCEYDGPRTRQVIVTIL